MTSPLPIILHHFDPSPFSEKIRLAFGYKKIPCVPGINIDSNPDLPRLPLEEIRAPTLVISARDDLFNTLPGPSSRRAPSPMPHWLSTTAAGIFWSATNARSEPSSATSWQGRAQERFRNDRGYMVTG